MSVGSERNKFFVPAFSRAAELQEVNSVGQNSLNGGASLDSLGTTSWVCAQEISERFELQSIFEKIVLSSQHPEMWLTKPFFQKIISSVQMLR